jgi:soluble lytic murein transglycosylase-like protein
MNGGELLDAGYFKSEPTQRTSCCKWLNIVGLCLFIGLTLYSNNEDSPPLIDDVSKQQTEGISNAEPIYYKVIKDASTKYALDPNLIATIIYVESRGNILAVSPRGAKGLMQLTPAIYKKYDVGDPFDMEQNVSVGTAHLAFLLRKFNGNLEHALAAYNCGSTRVIEYKGIPPIKETQEYVVRIMEYYLRGEVPTGFINQES